MPLEDVQFQMPSVIREAVPCLVDDTKVRVAFLQQCLVFTQVDFSFLLDTHARSVRMKLGGIEIRCHAINSTLTNAAFGNTGRPFIGWEEVGLFNLDSYVCFGHSVVEDEILAFDL